MSEIEDRVSELEDIIEQLGPAVRNCQASQGVHEFVILHLVSHFAALAEDYDGYKRDIVAGIEVSLKSSADATLKQYGEPARESVDATLAYFEDLKAKLLATVQLPISPTHN